MAKRTRTSITDLVGKKTTKPSLEEINKIADQIHDEKTAAPAKKRNSPKAPTKKTKPDLTGRFKRISLNAPLELYLDIQREATLQDKSMMQFILDIVEKDIAKKK